MTAKQKANQARFKKVVAEAKKLRKKNPKLTQAQAVKQAWAITYSKKKVSGYGKASKVGAVKKKSAPKKKAAKKSSSYHKDTKSHNVNIRVMSGVDPYKQMQFVLNDIKFLTGRISEYQKVIDSVSKTPASKRDKFEKKALSDAKIRIKNLKKALTETKKNIKF